MSVHCLFLLLAAFAAEDDDATCLLHLKSSKSVEARRAEGAASASADASVSPASSEHDAWLAQHKALREETHRRFPVPASGVPLALLSTNRVGVSTEEDLLAGSEQVSDAAAIAAADEAELLDADGDEKPNTDDPFADDYVGWRSTPSPVHELPNITIGEMNYLDSPTITSNTTSIQKFIYQQSNSAQACHAKLLEVRRTLDGILAKVNTLSDVVEAHDAIIAGNSRLIEDMVDKKNKAEKQYKEDLAECHKQYGKDLLALDQYRNEIRELEQIAEPDVRSEIDHKINYTQEVLEHEQQIHAQGKRSGDREKEFQAAEKAAAAKANETKEAALIQQDGSGKDVSLLSMEQCHKLVSLLAQRSTRMRRLGFEESRSVHDALHESHRITREGAKGPYDNDPETLKQCGGKRTELQEKFDEAWFALNKLLADGVQLAKTKKEECELAADNSHTDRIEQADTEIEASTVNVKGATMSMRQLQGLLENAKREVTLLEEHVSLLKSDCEVEDGATEQLKAVRTLIMSLENCPGRNDFRLTIPSESQRAKYEAAEQLHAVSDPGSTLAAAKTPAE